MLWMIGFLFGIGGTIMFFDIADKLDKNQPVDSAQIIMVVMAMVVCLVCLIASKWLDRDK